MTGESILDGFTIKGGHAIGSTGYLANGGGLRIQGSMVVSNCAFLQNFALNLGGGVACSNTSIGNITFQNCDFDYNLSNRGGAVDIRFRDVHFTDCAFSNNQALAAMGQPFEENGGAVNTQNSNCFFEKCTFTSNEAVNGAASLFFWMDWDGVDFTVEVDSCTFVGNVSYPGGAFFSQTFGKNTSTKLTNSSFLNNEATGEFPFGNVSIYHQQPGAFGNALIDNCLFESNSSNYSSAAVDIGSGPDADPSSYTITNCTFKNNSAIEDGGALTLYSEENTDAVFNVENCFFEGNQSGVNAGALWFDTGSDDFLANISHCEFIDNESASGGAIGPFQDIVNPATPTMAKANLDNCLVAENISAEAAISVSDLLNLDLLNCTIAGNSTNGLALLESSSLTLQNTVLANPGCNGHDRPRWQ